MSPLLFPDTQASSDELVSLYQEFVQGLEGLLKAVSSPSGPVADPLALQSAKDILQETLSVIRSPDPKQLGREEIRNRVNLAYDVQNVSVDFMKQGLALSLVPKARPKKA